MEAQGTNLFIVDDNPLVIADLRNYLENRFGLNLRISTFTDGESCLRKLTKDINIVILDYFMEGKNGLDVLKSIKTISPKTEVIMLSSNENVAVAIESFRLGAKDYVLKGPCAWKKITNLIYYLVTAPIRLLVREFGVSKFMAIFLMTFATMGVVVAVVLHYMKH